MDKEIIKRHVKELLSLRDIKNLADLCEKNRYYWQEVKFNLYELDKRLLWSAIEASTEVIKRWWVAGKDEKVRIYIRNLFWSMNDESGGIGWSSPYLVAEIIHNIPELLEPYGSMMIAHTIDEPPLVKGCLWGIGRIGKRILDSVKFFEEKILKVFNSEDKDIIGIAAWAMGEVGLISSLPILQRLLDRSEKVEIYVNGDFVCKKIGEWAEESVKKIS